MVTGTEVGSRLTKESQKIGCYCSNDDDNISNLPYDVKSHILSLMPTKDAVRTCVLSKDWKFKWMTVYNVDINDEGDLFPDQKRKNILTRASIHRFMQKIIFQAKYIKKFHLSCSRKHDLDYSTSLLFAALMLRQPLESFKLLYRYEGIVLPHNVLECTSLRNLELVLPCILRVTAHKSLPNLTTLCLEGVEIRNACPKIDPLVFNFPVLETFEIRRCKWLNVKRVEIYAPALTTLNSETPLEDGLNGNYSIKIYGARLAKFKSCGGLQENIVLTESQVVCAALENETLKDDYRLINENGLRIRMLLNGFSCLKDLHLWSYPAKAIFESRRKGSPLPMFEKLERLDLDLYDHDNTETLILLLDAAPFLKSLVLQVEFLTYDCGTGIEPVPSCIVSQLEEVKFNYFTVTSRQFSLAEFFTKNATKLKKIYLSDNGLTSLNEIVQQLSTFPKASTCLTITVVQ